MIAYFVSAAAAAAYLHYAGDMTAELAPTMHLDLLIFDDAKPPDQVYDMVFP